MKKKVLILMVSVLSVFLIVGTTMAYPVNVRPISGTTAGDFSTLQSDFNSLGIGFNAYNDQNSAAYFVPTGEGSTTTYVVSYTSTAYLSNYEVGVYDYSTNAKLKLWDESTGVVPGGSVSVIWNTAGVAAVTYFNGVSSVVVDTETGFGPVFGFYLDSAYGIMFSDDLLNNGKAQMLTFDGNKNSVNPNYWYIAMEGAPNNGSNSYSSGNIDFDDFIIKVESIKPVPEPGTLLLLGLGLLGIGIMRRKQ